MTIYCGWHDVAYLAVVWRCFCSCACCAVRARLQAIANSRSTTQFQLQLELANLLVRLRQWQQAMQAINKCLERQREGVPATENLQLDVEA